MRAIHEILSAVKSEIQKSITVDYSIGELASQEHAHFSQPLTALMRSFSG